MFQIFTKKKVLTFEKSFNHPKEKVWKAWTDPEIVKQWWGPKGVEVPECEIDIRVGGKFKIVMEAGESMGKYKGTRWPLEGEFTSVEPPSRFSYHALGWQEGKDSTEIDQDAELTLEETGGVTNMKLTVTLNKVESGAKMAAFGIKMSYKAHFKRLAALLDEQN